MAEENVAKDGNDGKQYPFRYTYAPFVKSVTLQKEAVYFFFNHNFFHSLLIESHCLITFAGEPAAIEYGGIS